MIQCNSGPQLKPSDAAYVVAAMPCITTTTVSIPSIASVSIVSATQGPLCSVNLGGSNRNNPPASSISGVLPGGMTSPNGSVLPGIGSLMNASPVNANSPSLIVKSVSPNSASQQSIHSSSLSNSSNLSGILSASATITSPKFSTEITASCVNSSSSSRSNTDSSKQTGVISSVCNLPGEKLSSSSSDKVDPVTAAPVFIIVPYGWRRVVEDGVIVYYRWVAFICMYINIVFNISV